MRCPACGAEAPDDRERCPNCFEVLKPKPPRLDLSEELPGPSAYNKLPWYQNPGQRAGALALLGWAPLAVLVLFSTFFWRIMSFRFYSGAGPYNQFCSALGLIGLVASLVAVGLGVGVLKRHGQDEEQRFLGWFAVGAGALGFFVNLWLARL